MDILFIKIFVLLLFSLFAAYVDYKKGIIYDWINYSLIGIGLVITVIESFFIKNSLGLVYFSKIIFISLLIYLIGYLFYYFGKLGGGDIKLFVGINLVLPYYHSQIFILWVLIVSSLLSVLIVSIRYFFRLLYLLDKKTWSKIFKDRKDIIFKYLILFILFSAFLVYSVNSLDLSNLYYYFLIPIFFGMITIVLDQEIKKHIYLKHKKIKDLEEGDVYAKEFSKSSQTKKLGLKNRVVLEKTDINRFKKIKNLKTIPIFDNLPKFGPFIFLGIILLLIFL